jgi:CRISPR type I-E-associated protein CasA/Cse1
MSAALKKVEEQKEKFDLYNAEHPFLQHPGLKPGSKPMAVLLYDRAQGNNPIFLDASAEAEPQPTSSAEAVRGLLVNLSFGGSHPDKSNPLSTGKENTMYAGPLCARLVVIVEGESLIKTLLLNLLVGEKAGQPAWERPIPPHPAKKRAEGLCDRYTRMTRFIRLQPSESGDQALSTALHMGEAIDDDPDLLIDPMMPLYLAADKKLKVQRIDPGRALWRSSHVLLNCRSRTDARPAKAMEELSEKSLEAGLTASEPVGLRVLGVAGNAQGPTTVLWRDETLPFNLSVVADESKFANVVQAISFADDEGQRLRKRIFSFAMKYLQVASPSPKSEDGQQLADEIAPGLQEYWSRLSLKGAVLGLGAIDPEQWEMEVNAASKAAFEKAVEAIPPSGRRYRAQFERPSSPDRSAKSKAKSEVVK